MLRTQGWVGLREGLQFMGVAMEALTGDSQASRALREAGFGEEWGGPRSRREEAVIFAFFPTLLSSGRRMFY